MVCSFHAIVHLLFAVLNVKQFSNTILYQKSSSSIQVSVKFTTTAGCSHDIDKRSHMSPRRLGSSKGLQEKMHVLRIH